MLLLFLTHFWPASTLVRGHLALATLSPPETDPQILERWGYADEDHLGKLSERRILVSNLSVTYHQESVDTMCDSSFQGGQGGQLSGQPSEGPSAGYDRGPGPNAQNSWKQTPAHASEETRPRKTERTALEETTGGRGPRAPGRNLDSGSRESGRAASGQQARIFQALRFQISRVMLA